jgi:hypothetical protein
MAVLVTDRILSVNFSTLIYKRRMGLFAPGRFPQAFSKAFRDNVGVLKTATEIRLQSKNV